MVDLGGGRFLMSEVTLQMGGGCVVGRHVRRCSWLFGNKVPISLDEGGYLVADSDFARRR